ncbi:MAG: GNAT family N-acetyltransferase [Lactimicrobium sp.]|jgi:ribosomal protein S18 acetylase RimI-like enzyme|uniref:GNAT family N-acetyltransferase n=1 Tax=Lactimicrobium sp. TaxID=2563780 RepID=UPI002F34FE35
MLIAKRLTEENSDVIKKIRKLYDSAFPANERVDLHPSVLDHTNTSEILYFLDEDQFVGFMAPLTVGNITHITYFAIDDAQRGKGYGSQAVALARKLFPHQIIIADLEEPELGAKNYHQRIKRVHFYKKNGFEKTGVFYRWEAEDYHIYSLGGTITEKQFYDFWNIIDNRRPDLAYD